MAQQQNPFILRDVKTGEKHPVLPEGLRVGRASQSDITLNYEDVSRDHAALWIQEGQLYIRDEGSTNGTWVNEERIVAARALQPGDQVRIGDTIFEVAMETAPSISVEKAIGSGVAAAQPGNRPVVPITIAGGVVVVVLVALMIRMLRVTVPPAETPTLIPTPAATATSTVKPTMTATPNPTEAPTRAVPPAPQAVAPELMAPKQGREYQNPIIFQWRGSLSGNQAYRVTAYHRASGQMVQSGLLTSQEWARGLPAEKFGEWRWTVSVMEGGQAVATSDEWMFWFQPYPGSGEEEPEETPAPPTDTPEF